MPITPLPDPPSTDDPSNFDARADAFLGALPTFQTEANALETNVNAKEASAVDAADAAAGSANTAQAAATAAVSSTGYFANSSASLSLTTGAKSITGMGADKLFADGDRAVMIRRSDRSARARGVVSSANMAAGTMTLTIASADDISGSGGPYTDWLIVFEALEVLTPAGRQSLWIPSAAMSPRISAGAAISAVETTTNKVLLKTLDFDPSTIEYVQFSIRMPKSWDRGAVTFQPVWRHGATTTNFKVSWGLQAVAVSDDDALDVAFGTAQFSNDTGGTTNDAYIGPESAAITIAGSPATGDLVIFQMLRKADDGTNDTLAVDAGLLGINVFINVTAGNDA